MLKIELRPEKLGKKTVMTKEIADARYERCNEGYMMTSWYMDKEAKERGAILSYILYEDGTVEWCCQAPISHKEVATIKFEYLEELYWIVLP